MTLITDLVDLAELTAAAREIEDPANYGLNAFLPDREIEDVEYNIRRGTITRGVAQFRSFDAETPIGRRVATTTAQRGMLPPVGQKLVIGEYERVMLQRAQGATNGQLVRQVYDDTRSNVLSIRARMERARGQVLSTGKFTLTDENGLTLEADYDVPAGHMNVAPGTLWSNPAADIFGDLELWMTTYQDDDTAGRLPGRILTSRRVVNLMRASTQVIKAVYGPSATEGRVTPEQLNGVLNDQGFPQVTAYDTKVGGTRVIADDKLIFTPADASDLGETQWGITTDALELVGSNAVDLAVPDAPGITATTMKSFDPARIWSKATAAAMPILAEPNLLFVADVV